MKRLAGRELGLVAVIAALWCGLLAFLPSEMSPDGWYALLGGDVIAHHGLPSHDALTVWGHGRRWVDQQWLAHLVYYGLYSLGGLRLALLVNAAIVVGSIGVAAGLARKRGGDTAGVLGVTAVAALALAFSSSALRPQTLVLPLFVAVAWLLIEDARRPSRRVFCAIPLLVLWANLHGAVTLGVLLVLLALAADTWTRRSLTPRSATIGVLAVASMFASPYAPHLPGYYRTVLFNGDFAKYLPDWMPTTLEPKTAAFYLLAFGSVVALARTPRALSLFEKLALLVLLALAIEASRGVTWFSFFALLTLPALLPDGRLSSLRPVPNSLHPWLAGAAVAAALAAVLIVAVKPQSWFESNYPLPTARSAASSAGSNGRVFANGAYADWLLLVEPSLRGRIAYDARFEILPTGRVADAAAVSIGRYDSPRILRNYDVLVLRPQEDELREALARTREWRRVATSRKVIVLRRIGAEHQAANATRNASWTRATVSSAHIR